MVSFPVPDDDKEAALPVATCSFFMDRECFDDAVAGVRISGIGFFVFATDDNVLLFEGDVDEGMDTFTSPMSSFNCGLFCILDGIPTVTI